MDDIAAPVSGPRSNPLAALTGGVIGTLGGLVGLGGAEFRLPVLIGVFQFAALEAVILNKAMSLIVVASALPFRAQSVGMFGDTSRRPMSDSGSRAEIKPRPGRGLWAAWPRSTYPGGEGPESVRMPMSASGAARPAMLTLESAGTGEVDAGSGARRGDRFAEPQVCALLTQ
jgi:hypothetical protein